MQKFFPACHAEVAPALVENRVSSSEINDARKDVKQLQVR